MTALDTDTLSLNSVEDVVRARQRVRARAIEQGFSLVDQTKLVTAASELARNTVEHGRGGTLAIVALNDGPRRGLRLTFEDHGPGIADIDQP
jgi:serine/threonine-protein kinase RsbT